jgi:hypothetical protein
MEQFLSPDFWKSSWEALRSVWWQVVSLLLIAFLAGWKWKGSNDDGEIRDLRAQRDASRTERDVYKSRLDLVEGKSENDAQELAALRRDTATLRRDIDELKGEIDAAAVRAVASALSELAADAERSHFLKQRD